MLGVYIYDTLSTTRYSGKPAQLSSAQLSSAQLTSQTFWIRSSVPAYDIVVYLLYAETVSHRGLGARAQWESCGLYRHVARRQLCECLDCATVSRGHMTSAFPHVTSHTPPHSPLLCNAR
jgi:hypothetical protein